MQWLSVSLKEEVREVFEPRYGRVLSDVELEEIAENLTEVMEGLLKFTWRRKYENAAG